MTLSAQFAFRHPAIRSMRRFSRQQRLVVVACLLTLAAGAGVGGWAPKFFARSHICMPSASFLEGRVAACSFLGSGVATRPYHTVCPTPIPVVCLSLVIRAAHTDLVRPLSFRSATLLASYFAFQVIRRPAAPIEFCRPHAPTGLELDPFHYLEA